MDILKELIISRIKNKGKITFADFMQMALYYPEHGYYNSNITSIGKSGDFYTSPAVHQIFGELVAVQLEEMWRTLGSNEFTVVEMGANAGWLCYDAMRYIKNEYPEFYEKIQYIIVESNPYMRKKQQELLCGKDVFNEKLSWHSYTIKDGFSFDAVQGCFLSNEFVDALPVHRLIVKEGALKEIYVGYSGVDLYEIVDEVCNQELKDYYIGTELTLRENQIFEISLAVRNYLNHVARKLHRGFVLTIDYGDTAHRLCRNNGAEGTVRCYYQHSVNREYYKRLGEQDITASVDFSHLMNVGKGLGLEVAGFVKQSHYLIALGVLEKLNRLRNNLETVLKVKNLFLPEGMGDIFKVLIQHKNVKNPSLSGLKPLNTIKFA
ncbi:MAG: SAM-dependent methyltransferase [Candidatus Kuenenia sp.]|nr:SAM-dependent methyltransferase [Candidatus Kuenenia hertensis]